MKLHRRLLCVAAVAAATLLSACHRDTPGTAAAVDSAALERAAAQIAQPAWLRERLPEHTIAYLRIPSFWGFASAPNGRALDGALASEPHTRIVAQLREAARKDPLLAQTGLGPAIGLFLGDLAGPVEFAAIDGGEVLNPGSNVLMTTRLDVADVAALNARVASLGAPLLKAPLDANGKGELAKSGFVYFDASAHRLWALLGTAASAAQLDTYIKQTGEKRPHAMHASEQSIDSSGQGLYFWMSLKGIAGMASAQVPASKPGTLVRDFFDKSRAIAFGWGTANGHGRFQYVMEAPEARLLQYLAPAKIEAAVKTAGNPHWAMTLALPTAEQLALLEKNLDADLGAGSAETYRAAMAKMKEKTGTELAEITRLVGPELIAYKDAAGSYVALRSNDRAALYARIDDLAKRFSWRHETTQSGGAKLHHLYIPALDLGADATVADATAQAWLKLYRRMGAHYFWVEDGSYLIFASVPQALADRAAAKLDTSLAEWLKIHQNYDPGTTLVGLTAATDQMQREVYYAYIGGLAMLGDALGTPVNLMDLPSASALKLPADGAVSVRFDTTRDRVGFSLGYEQSPVELLMGGGGGVTAVAVVGILAAVALPAYSDYTVRAQTSAALAVAEPIKLAIAEYYKSHSRMPGSYEDLQLGELSDSQTHLASYAVEGGAIVLTFSDQADAHIAAHTLVLLPYARGDDGDVQWVCGAAAPPDGEEPLGETVAATDVESKYLPADCR